MIENRVSRHTRLYNQATHLFQRRASQVLVAEEQERLKIMNDCPFQPMTRAYRKTREWTLPKGTSGVVSRLRLATEQRQVRMNLLTPRLPISNPPSECLTKKVGKTHSTLLVEVVRDGPTPEAECVNLGKFVVGIDANPASLAREFGNNYGLTQSQVMRLEQKLRINMHTFFGQ